MNKQPLNSIVGEQLSAVVFVQDYVQLQFGGPALTLTAFTLPKVKVGDTEVEYGKSGYRDALCSCISKIVSNAFAIEGEEIGVEFEDGSVITISLEAEDYRGPEAAMFSNSNNELSVW